MIRESELIKDFYKTGEAAAFLQISPKTVYRMTQEGRIGFKMSPTNRVQIPKDELVRVLMERGLLAEERQKRDAVYCRVSSHGQKKGKDLDRQVLEIIENAAPYKLCDPLILKDVGSGLNTERKGLLRLMEDAKKREIGRIFITHPDRLTRFGFSYLKRYFDIFDIPIICVCEDEDKTFQQELVDDMMALLASFSGKLYRLRKEDRKKLHRQIDEIPEEESSEKS